MPRTAASATVPASERAGAGVLQTPRHAVADFLHRSAGGLRDDRVVTGVASLAPAARSMLDIGASDGRVAARVAGMLGIVDVHGADVQLQPDPAIPVVEYDGRSLPFDDDRFDLVTIVDVLHHADDPTAVVRDALRVLTPGGAIVVKDHLRLGAWSNMVLYAMDTASNFGVHTRAGGRYLSVDEWVRVANDAGGRIDTMVWPFQVHNLPWRAVARNEYHLLLRIVPTNGNVVLP
jgi:SAM-dependent methyltransferase